jgi:hypothetical protein
MEDVLSRNQLRQVVLYSPAQSPLVEVKLHDPVADRVRLDSAARGFNFGQFGHRWLCWGGIANKMARQCRALILLVAIAYGDCNGIEACVSFGARQKAWFLPGRTAGTPAEDGRDARGYLILVSL